MGSTAYIVSTLVRTAKHAQVPQKLLTPVPNVTLVTLVPCVSDVLVTASVARLSVRHARIATMTSLVSVQASVRADAKPARIQPHVSPVEMDSMETFVKTCAFQIVKYVKTIMNVFDVMTDDGEPTVNTTVHPDVRTTCVTLTDHVLVR